MEEVRELPKSDIEEWKARFNRVPWGPKAEADRSAHKLRYLHFLAVKKDADHKEFSKDRTKEFLNETLLLLNLETKREQDVRLMFADNITSSATVKHYTEQVDNKVK